ncbi:MAG: class I SAM-dependent methyltransferase [Anaerolineales bacterium]|nr:class I SAM-dependent methyltransferase [Anaerolineales bacterium]MCW5856127.1 class I SAM-dependent methyltransferase [Anaerolineales bacterium]
MTQLTCRLCEHGDLKEHFVAKGFHLLACHRCGFVQVAEAPQEHNIALYDQEYFSHNKYQDLDILERENRRRLDLLKRTLPLEGARVLDAGCGVGDFVALAAAETGAELVGTDIAEAAIRIAQESYPHLDAHFHAGLLEEQDFAAESFDVICSWDVIEHIWQPVATYQRLFKFLKPGGSLLLSTPNIGAPIARAMGRYWAFMTPPEHLSFFNKQSMRWLAEETLRAEMTDWFSRGKWTNVGFLVYKAHRVLPSAWLAKLRDFLHHSPLGKLPIYVPTGDVQYAVIRKPQLAGLELELRP